MAPFVGSEKEIQRERERERESKERKERTRVAQHKKENGRKWPKKKRTYVRCVPSYSRRKPIFRQEVTFACRATLYANKGQGEGEGMETPVNARVKEDGYL